MQKFFYLYSTYKQKQFKKSLTYTEISFQLRNHFYDFSTAVFVLPINMCHNLSASLKQHINWDRSESKRRELSQAANAILERRVYKKDDFWAWKLVQSPS